METSEYSDSNNLLEELTIKRWASKVLNSKDRIIYGVKSLYCRTSHKFGIDVPHILKRLNISINRTRVILESCYWQRTKEDSRYGTLWNHGRSQNRRHPISETSYAWIQGNWLSYNLQYQDGWKVYKKSKAGRKWSWNLIRI